MEDREFSLTDLQRQHMLIFNALAMTLFSLMNVWLWEGVWRWAAVAMLVITPAICTCQYWSERFRYLRVSDEGLELRLWLRKPVPLKWDSIRKVELFEKPSFWTVRPFLYIIASASGGRDTRVPVYRPGFEELAGILKQRLPESVFEAH